MTYSIDIAVPFRVPFYAPFYAALGIGAYKNHGLDVTMHIGGSGAAVVDSLLSGKADVAWGGPARVMHEVDANPSSPLRCFCSVVNRDPFFLVGRERNDGFSLEKLKDFSLRTVSEVPTPWICLQDDIRKIGLDPALIRLVSGHTMPENAAAISNGGLEVAQLFEPYVSTLELQNAGHIWWAAASRGDTAYTSFITTEQNLLSKRGQFRRLVCAMSDTLKWMSSEGPQALSNVVADYFDDLPRAVLDAGIERYHKLGIWSPTPYISRESFERLAEALYLGGAVSRMPAFEACIDQSIVEEALTA